MAYERKCSLCQTSYNYCPFCDDYKNEPKWKTMFHDENCFIIFNTLQKHFLKELSDEEAISILENCDLSVLDRSTESIRNTVSSILSKKVQPEPEKTDPTPTPRKRQRSTKKVNNDPK